MSKRIKYIFLGLLLLCFSSLTLNMCQAITTEKIDLKKAVPEILRELKKKGNDEGEKYAKEIVDSIKSVYPEAVSSPISNNGQN